MERVLTFRELNRTTLLRQLLLARARLRVSTAIERIGALQAQWAPSPYVALWSRLEGFRREDLERALGRDAVVKATLMRATLHLVSRRDYGALAAAVRDAQLAARTRGVAPPEPELVERARALARSRAVTRRDLHALLGHEGPVRPDTDVRLLRQVHWLLVLARLEQSPECALWSPQRVTTFRVLDAEEPEPLEARKHLVRRYLAAFGPASRADLSQWSGVAIRDLLPSLEALRLRRFRDESGRELLDLPRAPIVPGDAHAPARLLPRWEETLLAYERRERVLPDEYRGVVIAKNGDIHETFLVDGVVGGFWRVEKGRVALEPFAPLPLRARRALEDEARRFEAFLR